jgi:3-isopropylmalate/(R)-2-methylmalate dehydratase small subunit
MKFTRCRSRVVPLLVDHVDTDQIIPARFLKTIERSGLGKHLFAEWAKDPSFALNREEHQGAQILLAGQNFGCGSSREHAPWALLARGFRAIIAGSFADIFANNALKNGLVPVAPSPADYLRILELLARDPKVELEVDLDAQVVRLPQDDLPFQVDPFSRDCLLRGIDPLEYLLEHMPAIAEFEARHG